MLNKLDVDLEKCRELVRQICGRGSGAALPPEELQYVPRARKVLHIATAEADSYYHAFVGTEHLLLALVRVSDGMAAQMLSTFGVLSAVQTETLRVMVGYDPAQPTAPG